MPQMNKGGKFIFGKSLLRADLTVQLPPQAIDEYGITSEGRVYLFTGSKSTGGFCITRKGLLAPSKLGHILRENPSLAGYNLPDGHFIPYKGRSYCWLTIRPGGILAFTAEMLKLLELAPGTELLSIRSSDIAFTMGAKGPLLKRAENFPGTIPIY